MDTDEQKNGLTSDEESDITLTSDEERIVRNLRHEAKIVQFGKFCVSFIIHDSLLKHGELAEEDTIKHI